MSRAVIVSAVRTPIGSFNGGLSPLSATALGSIAITEALKAVSLDPKVVDQVIMGNVLSAGLGQAPARQAALGAGLPHTTGCLTVNKVCGSGLMAAMLSAQAISAGEAEVIVAGGMESMSNAPYLLPKARRGYRLGHGDLIDSMIKDGLWDVYNDFHMGSGAELCARKYSLSRKEQDDYAMLSYQKALDAQKRGLFPDEIRPVSVPHQDQKRSYSVTADEEPRRVDFDKLRRLPPVFEKGGTVTAANASSISDGAAAVVLMSSQKAKQLGLKPLARIVGWAQAATDPAWFSIAPVSAIQQVVKKSAIALSRLDLIELHEAFSATALAVIKELRLDPKRINIHGGAIALGHPIGASGARILATLLHALRRYEKRYGLAALCIGGGEAVAMMVER